MTRATGDSSGYRFAIAKIFGFIWHSVAVDAAASMQTVVRAGGSANCRYRRRVRLQACAPAAANSFPQINSTRFVSCLGRHLPEHRGVQSATRGCPRRWRRLRRDTAPLRSLRHLFDTELQFCLKHRTARRYLHGASCSTHGQATRTAGSAARRLVVPGDQPAERVLHPLGNVVAHRRRLRQRWNSHADGMMQWSSAVPRHSAAP